MHSLPAVDPPWRNVAGSIDVRDAIKQQATSSPTNPLNCRHGVSFHAPSTNPNKRSLAPYRNFPVTRCVRLPSTCRPRGGARIGSHRHSVRFVGTAACLLVGRNDACGTGCVTGFVALAQGAVIAMTVSRVPVDEG
jgi:hypothetical protein